MPQPLVDLYLSRRNSDVTNSTSVSTVGSPTTWSIPVLSSPNLMLRQQSSALLLKLMNEGYWETKGLGTKSSAELL